MAAQQYWDGDASFISLFNWQSLDLAWIFLLSWLRIPWLEVTARRKVTLFSLCAALNALFFVYLPVSVMTRLIRW